MIVQPPGTNWTPEPAPSNPCTYLCFSSIPPGSSGSLCQQAQPEMLQSIHHWEYFRRFRHFFKFKQNGAYGLFHTMQSNCRSCLEQESFA